MKNSNVQISATEFKKHFLNLVDQVKSKHNSFIITKRKLPVAKVVPLDTYTKENKKSYFGCLRGTVKINDDIVNFSCESDWEVNND
ncbi:MAG: type II toxin-antitoxin system Phd/YefM family antitoxin [Rickettsia sp.]|uniref:type II toxin-antitoxin system Phd/YefM family antitoxin n=1 Tax=Rickettsia sp. TaxID=789 RepID=UPI001D35F7A9|nr:type II toxin-antitoxin system Phd/YefM family antitoxin [Rickettsia endosymbiont of Ecitomorpha arachnoides]HJD57662.1 type II toxin-antitoxin system Phd/YefM family antitoxin [Rickettsia endosymbiont of Ceroptres masudai]